MSTSAGPNISLDGLVFGYNTGYPMVDNDNSSRFSKGEPTENLIYDMGGTVTSSYPEVVYRCTANETNVVDTSVPGGKYSRFTGIDGSSNNQLYSRFSSYSIDVRGDSVNYSVYLKGSGTCHLTIYDNQSGYGTSSTITLTNEWVRYNYTRTINASATSYWVAVRGVLNTTDVYIAGQQAMRGTHSTPYVEDNRSSTQSLIDLKETTDISTSNVSFDSNAQMTFDGTDDVIQLSTALVDNLSTSELTVEAIVYHTSWGSTSSSRPYIANWNTWDSTTPNQRGFILRTYSTEQFPRFWYCWGAGYTNVPSSTSMSLNQFHHVVGVYKKDSYAKIYLDGVETGTTTSGTSNHLVYDDTTGTRIGYGTINTGRFVGELPIVKVYNKALSAQEVKQNFNAYRKRFGI
jgi:hypothetical protein